MPLEQETPIDATQDKDAQKIIDGLSEEQEEEEFELPSDKKEPEGERVYAEKYNSVEDLKKGITELKTTLPQYVIDGMSDSALEQHYLELRKDFSSKNRKFEKEPESKKEDEQPEEAKGKIPSELWSSLATEFESTGSITSDMYDSLEKAGIPAEIVDNYIDSLNVKKTSFVNSVLEIAGGQQEFDTIKAWAEDGGLSPSYMKSLETMPYDAILSAYEMIKIKYDSTKQQVQKRIVGNTNSTGSNSYTSQDQYLSDVADKRYGQNRAYTEAVDKKLAASKF